jgi:GPH family glycoside/pentoside/hexuronide:cation symporter
MRGTVALVPLLFLALSGIAMVFNPLGRGAHRRIVGQLSGETAA